MTPGATNEGGRGERQVIRPTRRFSALLGFLLKHEVDAIFKQQPFETEDQQDPLELWRDFDRRRQSLPPLAQGSRPEPLPETLRGTVEQIIARKTYREHYEPVGDYSFVLAPVEALLTPQWQADLDYIDELSSALGGELGLEQQLLFAMSEGRITEPIVTGNQVVFTSPRRDLHADPIPVVREIEGGDFEIVIRASSRPNYIQIAEIGGRLLVTNGVHRVCALYSRGLRQIPCLYRQIHNLEEAGLNARSTTLFRDQLFLSPRPALVTDLLNHDAAVPLRMRSMYQVLQVVVNVGTLTVPAIPPGTAG